MSLVLTESITIQERETFARPAVCHTDPCGKVHIWVRLLRLLNPYCHHEALLLCQISETDWLAWVPDHGEATLRLGQFFVNEEDWTDAID